MRYAPHASRYSLFALAVSAALLPGAGWAANGDLAGARKPPSVACSWNREAALSYEERRLDTPLPFSGANVVTHARRRWPSASSRAPASTASNRPSPSACAPPTAAPRSAATPRH
nr:hypothetical protein [Pseudomonas aeruginosa]